MLQYIANRAKDKAVAAAFKRNRYWSTQYCRCEETWENVVYLATHGYTIGRVGCTTSFLFLDIDESSITHEELAEKLSDWRDTLVLKGTSGLWYKHHIIIRTDPISIGPEDDPQAQAAFKDAVQATFGKVKALFPGRKIELDPASKSYWQCLYSYCEVDDPDPREFPIPGSQRLKKWAHKYTEGEAYKGSSRCYPLNQWALNRMFRREARPDIVRIDWDTYWFDASGRHRHAIAVGSRTKAEYPLIIAATYFARYCNCHYGTDYGKEDVVCAVRSIVLSQFADGKAHYSERAPDICARIDREWRASGAIDINTYALNRIPGAKLGYRPQDLDARALWDEYGGQILAAGDAAADLCYNIAEGEVAVAKSLIRRYNFRRRTLDKTLDRRKTADYGSILSSASVDASGVLLLPRRLRTNARFRKYLASRGVEPSSCKWI